LGALLVAAVMLAGCPSNPPPEGGSAADRRPASPASSEEDRANQAVADPERSVNTGHGDDEQPAAQPTGGGHAKNPAGRSGDRSAESLPPVPEAAATSAAGPLGEPSDAEADDPGEFPKPEGVDPDWQPEGYTREEPEPWDLGPPLVENAEELKRLDPKAAIWVDAKSKRLVLMGRVVLRNAPLELFACLRNSKEHESVVAIDAFAQKAYVIHAGLLAVGAEPGSPVQWQPSYQPPSGTEIDVEVRYHDQQGKTQSVPAQQWIIDHQTGETMQQPWVFAGSGFWTDERTGERHYRAAGGDIICVSNFATAILDVPIQSSQSNQALMFRAHEEAIPPLGTPVTLVLTPKSEP
ncbi:MAG: YdjY domain-containing protein, partial [Pirellulales bacterium]